MNLFTLVEFTTFFFLSSPKRGIRCNRQTPQRLILWSFIFLLFFSTDHIFSDTQKYDPLSIYKKKIVERIGPNKEKLVSISKPNIDVSAQYTYNQKNQLITTSYYLGKQPDGKTIYRYNKKGLSEEITYNSKGKLVGKIHYTLDKEGNISSYRLANEKLQWNFVHKSGTLSRGKRYLNNKLTEYFIFSKNTNQYRLQKLFSSENQELGFIKYFYEKGKIVKRIRKDELGFRKSEHRYTKDGKIGEILFFLRNSKGKYELNKKRIFFYPSHT